MENILNKRETIAVAAMQGMLMDHMYSIEIIPELAVKIADRLISQLDQPTSEESNPSSNS